MERKYIHCFVLTAEFSKRISGNYQNQFYLSPKSTPPDSCPQSFAIRIDRHAGNFGRHFDVWLLRKCGNWCSSVLVSCRPDKTKPCVTSESNYSFISSKRKLLWPSRSSLWVVTRRITNDERSARSRVLKRTRMSFQNQLKIERYVVTNK